MSDSIGDQSVVRDIITLNKAQIDIIKNLRLQGKFADAYSYVLGAIRETKDEATKYWFEQASRINTSTGAVAQFIRDYTKNGLQLSGLATSNLQDVSDRIARNVLDDIVANGGVRPLPVLLAYDITAVTSKYGVSVEKNLSGWGGSFFYWDMPIWDPVAKDYKYTVLANGKRNYLTIGDVIDNDPLQRSKFAVTLGKTLGKLLTVSTIWDSAFHISSTFAALNAISKLPGDLQDRAIAEARKNPGFNLTWSYLLGVDYQDKPRYQGIAYSDSPDSFGAATDQIDKVLQRLLPYVEFEQEQKQSAFQQAMRDAIESFKTADGGQFGLALGSVLGRRLSADPFAQIVLSASASTVMGAVGEFIDREVFGTASSVNITGAGLKGLGDALLANIEGAGVGALSSYLMAELVQASGLSGVGGELANSAGGAVLTQVISNLKPGSTASSPFEGVGPGLLASAVGSYLGGKLASSIKTWDSVGGQIGSAVGAVYSGFTTGPMFEAAVVTGNPYLFAAAVAVIAVDTLLGGLIGSLFGGTPRSGADVFWSEGSDSFNVGNAYARKGATVDAAVSVAATVADNLNSVLKASGSVLAQGDSVKSGNYGTYKRDFVYRNSSDDSSGSIIAAFSGSTATQRLIDYGSGVAIESMLPKMFGGDVYVKRAIGSNLENARAANGQSSNGLAFDSVALLGDLNVAADYKRYLEEKAAINRLIADDNGTGIAAGWVVTLARATELGLNRRGASDWSGGFQVFLDEKFDGLVDKRAIPAQDIAASVDWATGLRSWIVIDEDGRWLGALGDTIEAGSVTHVSGTDGSDYISLVGGQVSAPAGGRNVGVIVDGSPLSATVTLRVAGFVDAGSGDDEVHGSDLGDNILGGTGNDTLFGGRLDDFIFGDDGNDVLDAGSGSTNAIGGNGNYLDGGSGNDILKGREGSDWLVGGAGIDQLDGGDGDDILDAGAGDGEIVRGGAGSDQYIFRRGDGSDTIIDDGGAVAANAVSNRITGIASGLIQRDWTSGGGTGRFLGGNGEDAVVFGAGIDFRDLKIRRSSANGQSGQDLIIELTSLDASGTRISTGDVLTIQNWFDEARRVEWLKFADGTEVRIGDVTSYITGTSGNDLLIGTQGGDFISGGDGNDTIWGLGGNDFGFGGRGKDFISGDEDDDWLVGGEDDDQVVGGSGNDAVFGDAGDDILYGSAGNDLLSGGRGNDVVVGGSGNDTFRFERGDGRDTVFDDYFQSWDLVWEKGYYVNGYALQSNGDVTKDGVVYFHAGAWNGAFDWDDGNQRLTRNTGLGTAWNLGDDTLEFGLSIGVEDVQLKRVGNDLALGIGTSSSGSFALIADQITLKDWYWTGTPIEHFVFADVGRLDLVGWNVGAAVTDGDDTVVGGGGSDWITGGLGNDTVSGGGGDDILSGNAGNDTLKGDAGKDVLYGGAGNDLLDGGSGADVISGGAGIDVASYASSSGLVRVSLADARLNSGDASGDQFAGVEGLEGSQFADQLAGDAADNVLRGMAGNDRLQGGAGNDSYEYNRGDGDDIVEDGVIAVDQIIDVSGVLDTSRFVAEWKSLGMINSTQGGVSGKWYSYQLIVRRSSDNSIVYQSRDFADFLYRFPQDQMPSAASWPFSDGQWKLGAARTGNGVQTVISNSLAGDAGSDSVEIGKGISLSDLTASWQNSGKDLKISIAGGGSVVLVNQNNADRRVESVNFVDGLSVDITTLRASNAQSTAGADLFFGGASADVFSGGAGDDVISGGAGNDTLTGGDGDDVLEGGAGADRLDGGADSTTADHASLKNNPGKAYGDTIRYTRSAQGVTVILNSGAGYGGDAQGDVFTGIENVTGSEAGNDFLSGSDASNRLIGLGGDDAISGLGGDDVIIGGDGQDSLTGDDGDDALSGDAGNDSLLGGLGNDVLAGGDGDDTVYGDSGNDRINGDSGNDILYGGEGDDVISGGDGNDKIDGGAGNDTLIGGAGVDTLSGGDGDDILVGGAEGDVLQGGAGGDSYTFDGASGSNRIVDAEGVNKIFFSEATFDDIWLTRSGSDLLVQTIGGSSAIIVQDYFAADNASIVRSIRTNSHTLFLSNATALIEAMTATGPVPAAMPESVRSQLDSYWLTAGSAPHVKNQTLRTSEDTPLLGAVIALDEEEDVASYAVANAPAHGALVVHATEGTWTYTPGADWNGSEGFDIRVTDAGGHASVQHVDVIVAPVNDAPRWIGPDNPSVDETAVDGALVANLTAVDPDDLPSALTFTLEDNAGGRFRLTSDGKLVVNRTAQQISANRVLNFEDAQSHTIRVKVTDAAGASFERQMTVAVNDVPEAPTSILAPTLRVFENAANGTAIGTFTATDPDTPASGLTFSLADNAGGRFAISATGKLTVAAGSLLNFEASKKHSVTVKVTDANGLSKVDVFNVDVDNVNEAPTNINFASTGATITERDRLGDDPVPGAILLGTLAGVDPDTAESGTDAVLVYSVSDTRFQVLSGNQLWLKAGAMSDLDYETKTTVSVNVTVRDRAGGTGALSYTKGFSFNLTDRDDILIGTTGSDVLTGQRGRDILRGLGGNDTLFGGLGNDDLLGGDGVDTLNGEDGDDRLYGELGDDILNGGVGNDLLDGGDGNDALSGGDGGDTLQGGSGADSLDGGNGNDLLYGGADADTLTGGAGSDRLEGGTGDDILIGGSDADRFLGGEGVDTITYASATAAIAVNLGTGSGSAGEAAGDIFEDTPEILIGSSYADQITGSAQRDTIYGGSGNDTIYGGAGDDQLFGGDGNDYIDAQGGGDILDGGSGSDVLIGGTGNDTYLISITAGSDEIRNFDPNGTDIDVIGYQDINRDRLWFERAGNNLVISVVGTSTTTTVKDYFLSASAGDLANFKIDFIIAGQHYSNDVNVDGLVSLMGGFAKPADMTAYASIHANLAFENRWKDYWDDNGAPVLAAVADQTVTEDAYNSTPLTISIRATDDITPVTGISVTAVAVNSANPAAIDTSIVQSVTVGGPDAAGNRVLSIRTAPNASGVALIKVTAVDPGGLATEKLFRINVTGVADVPVITAAAAATPANPLTKPTLDSGSWNLNVQAALTDQDGSETLEVQISGLPAGLSFDRGANLGNGTWSFSAAQLMGLRLLGPSNWSQDLALSVTAISREVATGQTATTSTAVSVVINAKPSDLIPDRTLEVLENAGAGTMVGTFAATDGDAGDTRTYTLLDNAGGRFQIEAATGKVIVANGASFDFENASGKSHAIRVQVQDSGGLTFFKDFAIAVRDVNEQPTALWADRALSFSENIAVGTGLAWFGSADPEGNVTSYSMVNDAGGRFALRSDGLLMVGGAGLNFEAGAQQTIVVRATDAGGLSRDEAFTVNIGNVNEAPNDLWADRALQFSENQAVGTGLAWFGASDPEGNVAYYSLMSDAGGRFTLDSNGLLRVGSTGLNFEAGANQPIIVRATDSNGLTLDRWFNVEISNVNEAPTDIWADRALAFDENIGVGTGLAWFGGADPEGNIVSYALLNDSNGSFALRSDGLLMVGSAGLNFEAGADRGVVVRAIDANGAVFDKWFGISLRDVNEAPVVYGANLSIGEVAAPGTLVGYVGFQDTDSGSSWNRQLQFTLDGVGRENFSVGIIDANTVGIYYQQGALYDQDVAGHLSDYNLTLTARDRGGDQSGLLASAPVNIHVNPVNEAPTISYATMQYYSQYTATLQVEAVDPEGDTVSFNLRNDSKGQDLGSSSGPRGSWTVYSGSGNPRSFSGNFTVTLSDGKSAPKQQSLWINGTSVTWKPVVLDLDGDGLELTGLGASDVLFDMDGDGKVEPSGWVAADDAILAIDRNGNGLIDNGSEINLAGDVEGAFSDIEGLRRYDTNSNGFFDGADEEFSKFRLWQDLNQDGVSQAGELKTLTEMGVAAINLTLSTSGAAAPDETGNLVYGTTEFVRADGSIGLAGDVGLGYQHLTIEIRDPVNDSSAARMMVASSEPDETDRRVDQMRQAMAGFVTEAAEFERSSGIHPQTYDFFASAA